MMTIIRTQDVAGKLQPGDILLYHTSGFMGWAIRTKTYSDVNHSETYVGRGFSAASRGPQKEANGDRGVGTYPLRLAGLRYVLRPTTEFKFQAGLIWHNTEALGQGYDMKGLFGFFTDHGTGSDAKQFCSEHTARFAKKSFVPLFGDLYDCDQVSPGDLKKSPSTRIIVRAIPGLEGSFYALD